MIKAGISMAFFWVLLSFVKTQDLQKILTQIDWFFLAISFAVTLVMVVASCAKWKLILDLNKTKISFIHLFKIYCIGYFFSNILPSTVGGDVVRSYYAGRLIKNQAFSAIAVFVERFSGIFCLFLLAAFAPLLRPELYKSLYVFFPASGGLFLAALTVFLFKAENPLAVLKFFSEKGLGLLVFAGEKTGLQIFAKAAAILEKGLNFTVAKLARLRQELEVATEAIQKDRGFLLRLGLLTILFYILTWVNVYTCFLAFGVRVDFITICAIVPAIMFVAHIPITLLGNLGYFESVFVFYFLLVGVAAPETLAMGLLLRVKMLTMGVVGFGIYLIYKQNNALDLANMNRANEG